MTNKQASIEQVTGYVKDGMTIMAGGFLAVGTPDNLIQALIDQKIQNLTLIANDTGFPDKGLGRLVVSRQVSRVIASHIGTNPATGQQMIARELAVELVPQGTLAERVRCGGAGLGGVLTPTGVGTVVEEGKQKLSVGGVEYLLETPLRADVALIRAKKADKAGNLVYDKSARNFNPLMALAADLVIAEVDELVEVGEIGPDEVMTPGVVVDKIVFLGGC
ncbi:acetate CoA-transferase subunit alpha [Sporomusa termitida]|uniref:Acetate CoA-transferase subunit alpha n=1 Tax=Sporomusa termitida TaxID=2377 RepID=A0A517DYV6_9FIRM|nr:acetate CoA-transferase subunit alpha [Sporomusa termitida]QDR82531.1 Acetate CoA-transferase subunit alpha [Sporomusa termitida]